MPTARSSISSLLIFLILALAHLQNSAFASGWAVSIDEKTGLPTITYGGSQAASSTWSFWGKKWAWTDTQTAVRILAPYLYEIRGSNKSLDFTLHAEAAKESERLFKWNITLDSHSPHHDVIGGGVLFKFDLTNLSAEMGDPTLLPDNRGWTWGQEGKRKIELRFEPALASVYFERNNKSDIRAFFYKESITPGSLRQKINLSLSGDVVFAPTISERFGITDPVNWPQDKLDTKISAVDLSFLNNSDKPAGARGAIQVKGDQLIFPDGKAARFWGTNITSYALFNTPKEIVSQQAKRLAALGYNLVRIHHHDSPWANPNIFGNGKISKSTLSLDSTALEKLDWWVKCLKEEGIYVWMDLHVQRAFKADDNIYAFDELKKGKDSVDLKGFSYVNLTMQQAMKRFNEAYLNHKNTYTKTANKDEPAIIALLITNENDVTHHFGNMLLPDKNVPAHHKIYMSEAEGFAQSKGLPKDKIWRSWEHGPSKIFLNNLEQRFNTDMIDHVRRLGSKTPIATTNTWGNNPLSSLPALTSGDLIDVHSYGGYGQLEKNPIFTPNFVHWMAAGQVVGKPMTVTEWNAEPFPTADRHTLPLYVAASASHQGWDAMMHYAYTQEPTNQNTPSNWHSYNDPSLVSMLSAAALLYRQGHVKEASSTYVFDAGRDIFFNQSISPSNSRALRSAAEKGKLLIAMPQTKELPWLERRPAPPNATILHDPNQSVLPANASEAISDTGELKRNWEKGVYVINTPRTQAAMGWIGGDTINLPDIELKLLTKNVSVSVQSLGDLPINKSKEIMLSMATRSVPKTGNKAPFLIEPIEGQIKIRSVPGLRAYYKGSFNKDIELPTSYNNGALILKLDGKQAINWILLR